MSGKHDANNSKEFLQHLGIGCSSQLELSAVVICVIPVSSWSGWEVSFSNKMIGFKARLQQVHVCAHKHTQAEYGGFII